MKFAARVLSAVEQAMMFRKEGFMGYVDAIALGIGRATLLLFLVTVPVSVIRLIYRLLGF